MSRRRVLLSWSSGKDSAWTFITCVDSKQLPRSFSGRKFDQELLADLPRGVDACGENGEFHTCVLAGPMFRGPISAGVGEIIERDGFCFADLVPDLRGGMRTNT